MTDQPNYQYDPLADEDKSAEEAWQAFKEQCIAIEKHNQEFREAWPNYCQACGGWGRHFDPGCYSGPPEHCYPAEEWLCEALEGDRCHRCQGELETDLYEGENKPDYPICKQCGWRFDDGLHGEY